MYVAGPYSAPTEEGRLENTQKAIGAGIGLWHKGHIPFIPHLSHFVEKQLVDLTGEGWPYDEWMEWDHAWLLQCDAIYVLAHSPGVDLELQTARRLGILVFENWAEIPTVKRMKFVPKKGGLSALAAALQQLEDQEIRHEALYGPSLTCADTNGCIEVASLPDPLKGQYGHISPPANDYSFSKLVFDHPIPATEPPEPREFGHFKWPESQPVPATEPTVAPVDDKFHALLDEIRELHDLKMADYGSDEDPLANVRASEGFGIPGWVGAMVRGNDKMKRIQKFAKSKTLKNESVEDSLLDLAVYSLIALQLFREQKVN